MAPSERLVPAGGNMDLFDRIEILSADQNFIRRQGKQHHHPPTPQLPRQSVRSHTLITDHANSQEPTHPHRHNITHPINPPDPRTNDRPRSNQDRSPPPRHLLPKNQRHRPPPCRSIPLHISQILHLHRGRNHNPYYHHPPPPLLFRQPLTTAPATQRYRRRAREKRAQRDRIQRVPHMPPLARSAQVVVHPREHGQRGELAPNGQRPGQQPCQRHHEVQEQASAAPRRDAPSRDGPPGLVEAVFEDVVREALVGDVFHEEGGPGPEGRGGEAGGYEYDEEGGGGGS
ncbi:MAG: hypothetical protein L6R35_006252 [Caloplaca aegaea]|nr:MAG: hypothetical protein L6R35_006252 [Caloplaca aegaea]